MAGVKRERELVLRNFLYRPERQMLTKGGKERNLCEVTPKRGRDMTLARRFQLQQGQRKSCLVNYVSEGVIT